VTPKSYDLVSWIEIRNLHYFLNNSFTENNTWFIAIVETTPPPSAHPSWHFVDDSYNGDNSYAYHHQGGASRNWGSPQPYDFTLILTFNKAAKSTIPDSAEIGLKINGSDVIGTNGQGTWNSSEIFGSNSGELQFNVKATWEDVECNITLVQINYTKTILKASSKFTVKGSGQDILWNVTHYKGFNLFDDRLEGYRINFTIPATWNNINVFNGDENKTDNISSYALSNGYKIIEVLNAGNGTYWFLNATSFNLLKSIETYVGQTSTNIVNITNIIHFNATFYQPITQDDGTINLNVYSPAAISNTLNYSTSISLFNSDTEISIVDWDISDNATHCGAFRTQILWNNYTAAGFLEKILTITCDNTELIINNPAQDSVYYPEDLFNITVFFNDTIIEHGIDGATINIDINSTTYNTDIYDLLDGYYKIKINCSDPEFGLGWFAIGINASKQYYFNQSEILNIKITIPLEAPSVVIETPSDGSSINNTADIEINATITDDGSVLSGKAMINASTPFNISMQYIVGKWTCIWDNTSEYGVGDYKITIWAIDNEGIVNQTEYIIIALNDVINPSVMIEIPSDGSSHDNTVNIDINATITDKGSFISSAKAMINTTSPFNITMQNIASIWTCTWENLSLYNAGDYKITIWTIDNNNNINQTEFVIITIIDIIAPTWEEIPTNQTIELGTSFSYDVNASDANGIDAYYVNDISNFQVDANGVITNQTILSVGTYWLKITASDPSNNNATAIINITVQDNTQPTWVEDPQNQTLEFGDSLSYDVNATDPSGIASYWVNNTNFNIDANGLITNTSSLLVGTYWLRINALDPYDNNLTEVISITIEDTTAPTWIDDPINITLELGDSYSFDANATDPSGINQYWINNTNFNVDINGLISNVSNLNVGVYWITFNVSDCYGNNLTKVFSITIEDTIAPTWVDEPVNATLELGDLYSFDANATDPSGINQYWLNNTNFNVDANGLITNISTLNVGVYWITINVSDNYGNNLTKVFSITIEDTTAPTWVDEPVNTTLELGDSYSFDANATDPSGINQYWLNITNFNVDANGIITNVTMLFVGNYWIKINVSDIYGNNLTKVFNIIVQDTTAPTWIEEPNNVNLELGDSYSFDANATDPSGIAFYWINNTNFNVDANGLITNISALNVGVYWIKINVSDSYNNNLTKVFKITVQDTTAPTWDEAPTNQSISFGDSFYYDVNASDPSGIASYWVNDTGNFQINANGEITNTSILMSGVYWITINASDPYNNNITKVISIIVADSTAPQWEDVPTNQTIEFGDSFYYDLNATDAQLVFYYVNNTGNFTMDINTGELTNNTILAVGFYPIEVRASDGTNNNITVIVITVEDKTAPIWVSEPVDTTLELGDSYSFDANATDLSSIDSYWVNNTNFNVDANGFITNVSILNVGVYWIRINASDHYGNNLTKVFSITVEDTTAPTWVDEPVDITLELGISYSFDANATDPSGISLYWINNTNFDVNINGVMTNISTLFVGNYWIRINISDSYNNNITKVFKISIEDTTVPTWVDEPVDTTLELGDSYMFDANATDPSGISLYWINNTNFNVDSDGVITNVTTLFVGNYWIKINVSDSYNNNLTKIFKITIEITLNPPNGSGGGGGGGGGSGGGDNGGTSDPTLDFIFFIILGIIAIGLISGFFLVKNRKKEEILKRILIIKNGSYKGPDLLSTLLDNFNLQYDVVDLTENVEFPKVENYSLNIIMGHSIRIDAFSKKIAREREFIKLAFKKNIPIFGINLGLQLLLEINGAEIDENSVKEIGFKHNSKWYKVNLTKAGEIDPIFEGVDRSFSVFQLHSGTFKMTDNLELLATGNYCENQVVKIGEFNYGFQFHFELTHELLNNFLEFLPFLVDHDKEIILNDFEEIKENYTEMGKKIFTNYLKIIKLI